MSQGRFHPARQTVINLLELIPQELQCPVHPDHYMYIFVRKCYLQLSELKPESAYFQTLMRTRKAYSWLENGFKLEFLFGMLTIYTPKP